MPPVLESSEASAELSRKETVGESPTLTSCPSMRFMPNTQQPTSPGLRTVRVGPLVGGDVEPSAADLSPFSSLQTTTAGGASSDFETTSESSTRPSSIHEDEHRDGDLSDPPKRGRKGSSLGLALDDLDLQKDRARASTDDES